MKRIAQVITRMVAGGAARNMRALIVGGLGRFDFNLFTGPEDVTEEELSALREICPVVVVPTLIRAVCPLADWRAYRCLLGEFRKGKFDLVHTHTSKAGFLGRMAAAGAKAPVAIHSPEGTIYSLNSQIPGVPSGGLKLRMLQLAEQWAGRHTTWLTALSEHEKEICVRLGLSRADNTVVIPNGIDLAAFQPREGERADARREFGIATDELLLISIGRLSKEKGHDVLVQAFAKLADRLPRVRLMIVGDGPERPALAAASAKFEIRNSKSETKGQSGDPRPESRDQKPAARILFPGHRDDVRRLLAAADIFVLPSRYEGFGLAVVEAMAAGVPVIATRVGGVPEIIRDGTDGCLVPGGDVEALAEAIYLMAINEPGRRQLARAGQLRAQDFSREKMLAAYYRLYESRVPSPESRVPGRG